jgi:branched-chain amino acid transport system permease protein
MTEIRPLAFWGKRIAGIAVALFALAVLDPVLSNGNVFPAYWFQILLVAGINVTLAVSLNLINGFCGQFSLGHAGFMAVGGYASAYFTLHSIHANVRDLSLAEQSMWMIAALGIAGAAASVAGLLVGIPTLRLRGDYLAILTLGMGEIILVFILNINAVGGASGLPDIPGLSRFFWIWLVALGTIALSRNLFISSHGRAVLAVREDEIAAESLGVPTTRYKIMVFGWSAALAGMAGCLSAHFDMYLTPDSFKFTRSIEIVVMIILGGLGSTTGAVVGAILVTLLPEALRFVPVFNVGSVSVNIQDWRLVIYSFLLIVLMLTRPKGLLGGVELSWGGLGKIGGRWRNGRRKRNLPAEEREQGELL